MSDKQVRLHKYLADCGVMSRRSAEREIESGNVAVNGVKAVTGQSVTPGRDKVIYGGQVIKPKKEKYYIAMYKPRGYVTTLSDENGRKCVADLLKGGLENIRVYPVGRLDIDSEGLLLLTNDGELANKLTHPSGHIKKIYHVTISGSVASDKLGLLRSDMVIDGYKIQPVKTDIIETLSGFTVLRMTLGEGRNRQIRKMCDKAGLKIVTLKRVSIGEINLGNLSPGKWRELSPSQVEYLKKV